jgi:NAD(P)-dependent dehydrogenase (short-subunit alcohol dehydrogenase family)
MALNPGGIAVVTGGASGIGLALAHELAAAGMRPVLLDVNAERRVRSTSGTPRSPPPLPPCSTPDRATAMAAGTRATLLVDGGRTTITAGTA